MPLIKGRALELIKAVRTGEPVLNLNRGVAAESLWPAPLETEADKASSILRSFFVDGFIVPYRTLGTCPQEVIRDCQGLAVFHILRAGLQSSSASGSGVVISRISPDRWSGAFGIVVDYDLPEGLDVADVVVVVNDEHGLEALSRPSGMLGKDLAIKPGPIPQSEATGSRAPITTRTKDLVFFYVKSKGQLVELDLSHLIIREAKAENERFYGVLGVSAKEILSGQVETPAGASDHLYSTIKSLDRRSASLSGLPKSGKCPGDHRVKAPVTV